MADPLAYLNRVLVNRVNSMPSTNADEQKAKNAWAELIETHLPGVLTGESPSAKPNPNLSVDIQALTDRLDDVRDNGIDDGAIKADKNVPAFFSRKIVHIRKMPDQKVEHLPFQSFWLVYRTDNGVGFIDNVVFVSDNRAQCFGWMSVTGYWTGMPADFALDADPDTLTASGRDYFPEVIGCILALDNKDGQPTDRRLVGQSPKRAERLRRIYNIPAFILVRPTPERDGSTTGEGGGWTQRPHNRRGHWRTIKKSGKRVWVRDHAINGGTDTPRHYLV